MRTGSNVLVGVKVGPEAWLKNPSDLANCGKWALKELQRLCHMAKAPPTGGEWSAWYARFCNLIGRYHERKDDAGRLNRRLQREMASLWVFLCEHGVEATNNRAERALRFGVLWRKRLRGTDSVKGNHWVERSLSLRQTCRQRGQSTLAVLVDALTSLFCGHRPSTLSFLELSVEISRYPLLSGLKAIYQLTNSIMIEY